MIPRRLDKTPHKITQKAFTLIELLAVVFVVGMIAVLVVVNIERDTDQLAFLEAKRFAALARHVQDESILHGLPMGIGIDPVDNSYHFVRQKQQWELISDDDVFRQRQVPDVIEIELLISGEADSDDDDEQISKIDQTLEGLIAENNTVELPQIIMEPYGLVNQFTLAFSGDSKTYRVEPDLDQKIVVSKK